MRRVMSPRAAALIPQREAVPSGTASWVATRSYSSHEENGSFCFGPPAAGGQKKGSINVIDINLIRKNPDVVRENIRKKFQDAKLPLVDEVIDLDRKNREAMQQADSLRNQRKVLSKEIGGLMKQGKKEEAEATKAKVAELADELERLEKLEEEYAEEIKKRMQVIPQIIDDSVPIGKDDSENVEIERFGEPFVPDFEIPYHVEIMEKLAGIDIDSVPFQI